MVIGQKHADHRFIQLEHSRPSDTNLRSPPTLSEGPESRSLSLVV